MTHRIWAVGSFAAMIGFLGCAVEVEPGDEHVDEEALGEAQQEVGVGGTCTPFPSNCDAGLNCCHPGGLGGYRCRDLQNDENNCGACNNACSSGERCHEGECVPPGSEGGLCLPGQSCNPGLDCCAANPGGLGYYVCTDLQTDKRNCGSCGRVCKYGCNAGNCIPG